MLDTLTLDTLTVEAGPERTLLAHPEEKEERRQASAGKKPSTATGANR